MTLTSRAFYNDQLGPFAEALGSLVGKDLILPMNSGAEAVETAIKVARKWGAEVKGVPPEQGRIVVMDGNFHGRTTTIVGFSTDDLARQGFGPFTPGFDLVPYGKADAVEAAITDDTVAVLLEPIQGEAGVLVPPPGFLRQVRDLCDRRAVLFIADEIQSGLARTGRTLAVEHEDVVPDIVVLGKALGGGILPLSAVAADADVLGVITPGSHGSIFGGNPLASAVGHEVCLMLETGEFQARAAELGTRPEAGLNGLGSRPVREVRCRGLWAGVDLDRRSSAGGDVRASRRAPGPAMDSTVRRSGWRRPWCARRTTSTCWSTPSRRSSRLSPEQRPPGRPDVLARRRALLPSPAAVAG